MKGQIQQSCKNIKAAVATVTALLCLGAVHSTMALNLAQAPLFLSKPIVPMVMLNMSNDHQLYFKVYDDYSDVDGDNVIDTTYNNSYDYYGYFDEEKCYEYNAGMFKPTNFASNHYCSTSDWSGNFLNWSTMTRMDVIRKILYGGMRSTDTPTETVLERAYLPQDAHSFAKYYNGGDISKLTSMPNTAANSDKRKEGITICNTTEATGFSHHTAALAAPPLMRVVTGNYSLWASNERWQCKWSKSGNGNDPALTKIPAYANSPSSSTATKELNVRVQSCVVDKVNANNNENCKAYSAGLKPAGLLQTYGEDDSILFGLLTGSYTKNKSGGVLRKNVSSMTNEISADGTFLTPAEGIIKTLDLLRISQYDHGDGSYLDTSYDNCTWNVFTFNNNNCINWGNPQTEIYLESLRYLAGKNVLGTFNTNDNSKISGLNRVTWVDPITDKNYCAPLSVIQFNASTSSYDGDELGAADTDIITEAGKTLSGLTDFIGEEEGLTNGRYFVGQTGTANDQLCTPKTIANLSNVSGTCPDAPRLGGTYKIAGLAHYARTHSLGTVGSGANQHPRETVKTYGVALAPSVPQAIIPTAGGNVTLLPGCRQIKDSGGPGNIGNCAIMDFKFIDDGDGDVNTGALYVNYESTEQGSDFDQDMWGTISYKVDGAQLEITTNVIQKSTSAKMSFGYVLSGVTEEGYHSHSGVNGFEGFGLPLDKCKGFSGGCSHTDGPNTQVYTASASDLAAVPEQPLYYAAKWGGFDNSEGEIKPPADAPKTYFKATDPRELEESLDSAFNSVAKGVGAAASVATNSTRLGTNTFIYQATFDSTDWSGNLQAIGLSEAGKIADTSTWVASDVLPSHSARKIYTYNGSSGVEFTWANLNATQQFLLQSESRLNWVRGEDVSGLRERDGSILGDIVNSDPVFSGQKNYGFSRLSDALGGDKYTAFVNNKNASDEVVYVNSNDGMLHAFDADTGVELFAYIPSSIYAGLKARSDLDYRNNHQFLVNGQVFVGDVYVGSEWKTLLVGAFGAGGKGLFVLDVTDPSGFNPSTDVLYEINDSDVGYILGKPTVAPMADGSWKIIFGNGYNSTNQSTGLVMANPETGSTTFISVTATAAGTVAAALTAAATAGNSGLAEPSMSIFSNGTVRAAYAGDLIGNMWKFNLKTKAVDIGGKPLFIADSGTNPQPITAAPILGSNQQRLASDGSASTMVYFGTGRYLTLNDITSTALQSFYGVADRGASETNTIDRSMLSQKDITQTGTTRDVNNANEEDPSLMSWPDDSGWLLDFNTVAGERVASKPLLIFDRLIFPTVVPTEDPCQYGGSSWIMELVGVGDLHVGHTILDDQGTENDTLVSLSDLIHGQDGNPGVIIEQDSDGTLKEIEADEPTVLIGRQSWRQIQ